MRVNIPRSQVKDNYMFPKNIYPVTVKLAEQRPTKDGKGTKLYVELSCIGGPVSEAIGETLFLHLSFSEKALFRIAQLTEACSIEWGEEGFEIAELPGKQLNVAVAPRTYTQDGEEKQSNDVKEFLPAA